MVAGHNKINEKTLKDEIDSITKQLLKKYKPEKIILFGSAAEGKFSEDSDLDFLVVKKDTRSPIKVEQFLHANIDYDVATDFIFLHTEEFNKRSKKDILLKEMLSKSKMLYG